MIGQRAALWLAAACLPVASHAAAAFVNVEPATWLSMPSPLRSALVADALLYTAACAIVAAPAAAATIVAHRRAHTTVVGTAWPLIVATLLFVAASSVLTLAWAPGRPDATAFVLRSHTTVLAVMLALTSWGAVCGAWFRDPLDAVAVSLLVVLAAAGGLLVAGAAVADLPEPLVAVGLAANPLVVITSAANIDIVRMDLLYQISPLAHRRMDYPAWHLVSGAYLALAFGCFAGLTWMLRTWPPASVARREDCS